MFNLYEEDNERIIQERLIALVENHLNLKQWKFNLQYKSSMNGYIAIYDSPSCRLRCSLYHDPRDKDDAITFDYGRKHAPNEEYYMVYQGEKCLAWHAFLTNYVGQFLDGIEPRTLARTRIEHNEIPSEGRKRFVQSEKAKSLLSPIWGLRLEAFIWEYYGSNLFELFDLRYPKKWASYRNFLIEFYDELNKDSKWKKRLAEWPNWKPFPWLVC